MRPLPTILLLSAAALLALNCASCDPILAPVIPESIPSILKGAETNSLDTAKSDLGNSAPVNAEGRITLVVGGNKNENSLPVCIVTASEAEALSKYLAGFKQVFTGESGSITPPSGFYQDGSELEFNCGMHISKVKNSLWRILNHVWLITSCQHPDQMTREEALLILETERENAVSILKSIYIQSVVAGGTVTMRPWDTQGLEQTLEIPMETIQRMSCNPLTLNLQHVSGTFDAVLNEMMYQMRIMEAQKQSTQYALQEIETQKVRILEALNAAEFQRERVELGLLEFSKMKTDALAAIRIETQWNVRQEGRINTMEEDFIMMRVHSGKFFNLESSMYGGEYICMDPNPQVGTFLNAFTAPATLEELKQDRCLWQLIPVPPNPNGEWFYLRNKMEAVQPIPKIQDEHYLHILPEMAVGGHDGSRVFLHLEFIQDHMPYYLVPAGNMTECGRKILGSPNTYEYSRWIPRFPSWYY